MAAVRSCGNDLYQPSRELGNQKAWLFSFLNEYGQEKEKKTTLLTKVESIVLNVLGLPNLSEVSLVFHETVF